MLDLKPQDLTAVQSEDRIKNLVDIWKKIVDVQQHFNDLELRIRNFAILLMGAFLGLGGYAIRDGGSFVLFGLTLPISGFVILIAELPLAAFYLMDRFWYHRLLDGSVNAGIVMEKKLRDLGVDISLGSAIKDASPVIIFGRSFRSKDKMDWFYRILGVTILLVSALLTLGQQVSSRSADSTNVSRAAQSNQPAGAARTGPGFRQAPLSQKAPKANH